MREKAHPPVDRSALCRSSGLRSQAHSRCHLLAYWTHRSVLHLRVFLNKPNWRISPNKH